MVSSILYLNEQIFLLRFPSTGCENYLVHNEQTETGDYMIIFEGRIKML